MTDPLSPASSLQRRAPNVAQVAAARAWRKRLGQPSARLAELTTWGGVAVLYVRLNGRRAAMNFDATGARVFLHEGEWRQIDREGDQLQLPIGA